MEEKMVKVIAIALPTNPKYPAGYEMFVATYRGRKLAEQVIAIAPPSKNWRFEVRDM